LGSSYSIPKEKIKSYAAHDGPISSLASVGADKHTVSAGTDGHIKIWAKGGTLLADWNINVIS
jgi:WD40 repeat protein